MEINKAEFITSMAEYGPIFRERACPRSPWQARAMWAKAR